MEAHYASETAISLGARPCSVLSAAVSNEQPACTCAQEKKTAHSLSGGGAARALTASARFAALIGVGS